MQGEVVFFYAFDVANEIVPARVRSVLGQQPTEFELAVPENYPRDVPLVKPLALVPAVEWRLFGQPVRLLMRIYEVGVVTLTARVSFTVSALSELARFHRPILEDGRPLGRAAFEVGEQACGDLQDALVRPSSVPEPEAYTAFVCTNLGPARDAPAWLAEHGREVAGLLTETNPAVLSPAQVAEVLRLQRSYATLDLVVPDWDAAFVVELDGSPDSVLYVFELANLQLEEFRAMDRMLDAYLDRAHEHLERRPLNLFGISNSMLSTLRRFRVDATKLADEVSHITKFLGDWYLARVYLAVRERFHLDQWRASVHERLTQLDQLYNVLHAEVNERRMLWLEAAIVLLFVIDVAVLLLGKK
ncbi:MAG: hypothetical protein JNM56_13695 [Planctomycetia bacterium]|nr:hypothetical protein [Planctomycetia bacterium]